MMKYFKSAWLAVIILIPFGVNAKSVSGLEGAWQSTDRNDNLVVRIMSGRYFSEAVYSNDGGKFVNTRGGTWGVDKKELTEVEEFNTGNPDQIGKKQSSSIQMGKDSWSSGSVTWKRLDDGKPGALAGAWLITGRMRDGQMEKRTPGARKTMKILSGTRFQWIAYNVDTKEFFGTGGGHYTTLDGKYTEYIDFFSRDNSRVGASLEFDYALTPEGDWHHSGFSSKGDPLDELWTLREKLEQ